MPASFKKGDAVKQKLPAPITGEVIGIGETEGELGYCVGWKTADGDNCSRWFRESDLETAK